MKDKDDRAVLWSAAVAFCAHACLGLIMPFSKDVHEARHAILSNGLLHVLVNDNTQWYPSFQNHISK